MPTAVPHRRRIRRAWFSGAALVLAGALLPLAAAPPAAAEQASSAQQRVAVASVAAGLIHTCVLTSTGAVRCWGNGGSGQLGYGDTLAIGNGNVAGKETPADAGDVPLGGTAVAIATGNYFTCALLTTGAVRCWGSGFGGQLGYGDTAAIGNGTNPGKETPAAAGDVPLGGKAVAISAGPDHACAVLATGAVRCWGSGSFGQLGYGNTDNIGDGTVAGKETPAAAGDVPLGGTAVAVSAGGSHTCALLITGALRCWGRGLYGVLGFGSFDNVGDGTIAGRETPAAAGDVPLGGTAVAIAAGGLHTCAVLSGGQVRCWGSGNFGQLGYGNTDNIGNGTVAGKATPADAGDVPVGGTAVGVTTGDRHTCAQLTTGALRCWGNGGNGRLGYGDTANIGDGTVAGRETAADAGNVPLGGTTLAVSASATHTCAVITAGSLRCWGSGSFGELGYGNADPIGDGSVRGKETPAAAGDVPLGDTVRFKGQTGLRKRWLPRRDRTAPYVYRLNGALTGPFVKDAATCSGTLRVVASRGSKKLAVVSRTVRPDCTFSVKVQISGRKLRVRTRTLLTLDIHYLGSTNLRRITKTQNVYAH